jgi:hypothetical protein
VAGCIFYRLDSLNTTTTVGKFSSRLIYNESEGLIYSLWREIGGISFGKYNPVTHVASGEVQVEHPGTNNVRVCPYLVRLTDGRLIAVYYHESGGVSAAEAKESSDNGATWSVATVIGAVNDFPCGVHSDGTNVIVITVGLGSADLKAWTRSGVDTWSAAVTFYNSGGGGGTPGPASVAQSLQGRDGLIVESATVGAFVYVRSTDGTSDSRKLTAWYTTDGFATATAVDIRTHTAAITGYVASLKTSTNRYWVCWADTDSGNKPRLAYSDDHGVTWTDIGTPTVVTTEMTAAGISSLDESFDLGFCLDERENLLLSFTSEGAISPGYHFAFRSVNPILASGWVTADSCTYIPATDNLGSVMTGQAVCVGSTMHRLVTVTRSARYSLEFMGLEAGIREEPEEPPSPEAARESGADDNNLMFRIDLSEGRGWSLHALPPACFLTWDEGDKETGREVGIILIGNPSIDPATSDPEITWGFRRIETGVDDGYGWRAYVDHASDDQQVRYDPMRFLFKSKVFTPEPNGEMHRFLFRQAGISYAFDGQPGETVPVAVIVDRVKLNRVIELPTTHGEKVEEWFSLPTSGNVGECVQFVVDESSNRPLSFDVFGVSYMRKRRRS